MAGGTQSNTKNSLFISVTGVASNISPEITPNPTYESVWFYNNTNNTWSCTVDKSQSTGPITISASGYISHTITFGTGNESITIVMETLKYVSNLSNGTDTYIIKDANAYHTGDLATVATSGSYNDLSNKPTTVIEKQEPTSSNNYTWYRKYSDGWVEQGILNANLPQQNANTVSTSSFTLPITMANTDYAVNWARTQDGGNTMYLVQLSTTQTTTVCQMSFFSTVQTSGASKIDITVSGKAAS